MTDKVNVTLENNTTTVVTPEQGPPGPPGGAFIGSKEIKISDLASKNLLSYNSTENAWVNVKQEAVTDGGNF